MDTKWLEWAKQIQAISQIGLTYSKDPYDLERYEALRELSVDILAYHTTASREQIRLTFASDTGYATPKVDVRAVIFEKDRLLLVREKIDGAWALPGGWADIGYSPSEVAVKEVKEESGYDVKPSRLLAVLDKKFHLHPRSRTMSIKYSSNAKSSAEKPSADWRPVRWLSSVETGCPSFQWNEIRRLKS
ncbi:NUDIX hydrolase N-terminal domain-containing protein [Paenibacillus sp. CC-CFT747]|nr:NUDIX hydrolase N-terminal domain-containing protein [Paenibacillus sp. CC-CFT747]